MPDAQPDPSAELKQAIPGEERPIPTPGYLWRGQYVVNEPYEENSGTSRWHARRTSDGVELCLSAARTVGPARQQGMAKLRAFQNPVVLKQYETVDTQTATIEISEAPGLPSLRAWRVQREKVTAGFIQRFLETMIPLLSALHEQGVGHFNLRPEAIYVAGTEDAPSFRLGAWDCCVAFGQKDLITIPVDPYYAPPECAGLHRHPPTPEIVYWDWWSLGRVLQELILGQHVLATVMGRSLEGVRDEFRTQAENLLLNRLPGEHKAGAIESMPPLDKRLELLLKGLLSPTRDTRWGSTECGLWLKGESPREHYLLQGKERCHRWQGQAYTVAEAAETLRSEDNWQHAADELLQPEKQGTLAWFILKYSPDSICNKLKAATGLLSDESLQEFPPAALREIVTMIALLELAGGKLIWRGRRIDLPSLKENLAKEDGGGQWLGTVWALTSAPILCLLDKLDAEAGRILTDLGRLAGKTVDQAMGNGWLAANAVTEIAKLWELSCEHPGEIQSLVAALRRDYACSTQSPVQDIFRIDRPAQEDAITLAFLSINPERYGFVTHEAWSRTRYTELVQEGLKIARAMLWLRLRKALKLGPWWYGRIWWMLAGWGGFALAFSLVRPGPLMAVVASLPALFAIAVRLGLRARMKRLIIHWCPELPAWKLLDNTQRCDAEFLATGFTLKTEAELEQALDAVNQSIAKLKALQPPPAPVQQPPSFLGLRFAALASWLVFGLVFTLCGWQFRVNPPSWEKFRDAWGIPDRSAEEAEARRVKLVWPFKRPDRVPVIKNFELKPLSEEKARLAKTRAAYLLREYNPATINSLVLVRLPIDENFCFVVWDGGKGALASKEIVRLPYNPLPRTWMEIDGKAVMAMPE